MRALLIGFGNVGRRLARILVLEREKFPRLSELDLQVVGLVTATRGGLANPRGVNLKGALKEIDAFSRFSPRNPELLVADAGQAARDLDYDVLIETSPLNIEGCGEPAVSWVRTALARGRSVVTANKGPVAFAYEELTRLARENGALLLNEATVMDGTPIFSLARAGLRGCRILELEGILNSTVNFVLTRLEQGDSLETSVQAAQKAGFAEADPSHDLEGWDAAAKICVLANALMGTSLTPLDVARQGVGSATPEDVQATRRKGRRLKQVCRARGGSGNVKAEVALREMRPDHPFAVVSATGCILKISTDLMTPIFVCQHAPDLTDTAFGILSDLLEIQARRSM